MGGRTRAAAGHRRRRVGQDQHAGPSRRPSDRRRRRPAPHPAPDLLAARGRRDGAAGRAHRRRGARRRAARRRAALAWSGTFHAIGARLLREHAAEIGLDPAFTIHDREDSADLMNLVRHELGLSKTETRFPTKGTCLAIYSRAVNAEARARPRCSARAFPGAPAGRRSCRGLFGAYVEAKQAQNVLDYDDLLLYWAGMLGEPAHRRRRSARASTMCWSTSTRTPTACRPRSCSALKPDGRGLTVVGDDAQSIYSFRAATVRNILDFPAAVQPAGRDRHARPQLPLDRSRSSPPPTR